MKFFRRFILLFLMIIFPCKDIYSHSSQPQLYSGFQTGNADALSAHFNERFQLIILGVDYRISKAQATEIMRDFFKKYPPVSFSVLFKGEKKESYFIIGKLVTRSDVFQINIFFRKTDSSNLIHLLEIEKENESTFR